MAVLVLACGLAACASLPFPAEPDFALPAAAQCSERFALDDRRILHDGVRDAQYRSVPGFPYFRVNRFLASLRDLLVDEPSRRAWLGHLSALDERSRTHEWRNAQSTALHRAEALSGCRALLIEEILTSSNLFQGVINGAEVPDDYAAWKRIFGVYPISAWFVRRAALALQTRESAHFGNSSQSASLTAYRHTSPSELASNTVSTLVRNAPRDALGIPRFKPVESKHLFDYFQPQWVIDDASEVNRPGAVDLANPKTMVDTGTPAVYTAMTFVRFDKAVLVQLNYTIWFTARPKLQLFDLYGGRLDGLTLRLTLDTDGDVLLADVMHNCGCYYMAFPSAKLKRRDAEHGFEEPLWMPAALPAGSGPLRVRLASNTHYLRELGRADPAAIEIPMMQYPYATLKSLQSANGSRQSLFSENGLVKGTERLERFVLWPMGVASAGAMRAAGRQPIAFVGRRHFDDADLMERYFSRTARP